MTDSRMTFAMVVPRMALATLRRSATTGAAAMTGLVPVDLEFAAHVRKIIYQYLLLRALLSRSL